MSAVMNHYRFLDVGFGDTFLLYLGNKTVMVDCWKHDDYGENVEDHIPGGVIDALILTHQHFDHYFGIERLLTHNIIVRELWESPWIRPHDDNSPGLDPAGWDKSQHLVAQLRARGTVTHFASHSPDPFLAIAGCSFRAFNPPADINQRQPCELHDGCLVIMMSTNTNPHEILFCGDANYRVLDRIASDEDIANTRILCCPHHGGLDSLHEGLIKKLSPDYIIISAKPNTYGGPIPEAESVARYMTLSRIATKRTWVDGTVDLDGRD